MNQVGEHGGQLLQEGRQRCVKEDAPEGVALVRAARRAQHAQRAVGRDVEQRARLHVEGARIGEELLGQPPKARLQHGLPQTLVESVFDVELEDDPVGVGAQGRGNGDVDRFPAVGAEAKLRGAHGVLDRRCVVAAQQRARHAVEDGGDSNWPQS